MPGAARAEGASGSGNRDTTESPRRPSNRSPKHSNTSSTPVGTVPTTNSDVYRDSAAVNAAVPKVINKYLPRIAAIIGVPPPTDIKFKLLPGDQMHIPDDKGAPQSVLGLATTDGTILLNEDYVVGATESQLEALVAHEMTHEFLRGLHEGAQGPAKVFVEGLADYVRDAVVQNSPDARTPQRGERFQNPEGGYQGGAGLFQWLEGRKPGTVKAIVASLEQGDETPLISVTGKSFPDLVDEYHNDVSVTRAENKQNYQQAGHQYAEAWAHWVPGEARPQYQASGTYAGMVDNPTSPQHLGPHYAAGPNPGITVVEAAATPATASYSPISGMLANGKTIGFDVTKPQPMGGPPAPPTIGNPNGGGDTGSGSGSGSSGSSGSSSSGGSSAPAAPPMDTYISDTFKQDAVARQKAQMFAQAYMQLWAEPATEAYIVQAAQSGMNVTEFVHRERMKNAWKFSDEYKKEAKSLIDWARSAGAA